MTARPAVLLLDLAPVVALVWLLGRVAERLGRPAVIGEIWGGTALGPTRPTTTTRPMPETNTR